MTRGKLIVEYDNFRKCLFCEGFEFLNFAGTDVRFHIWTLQFLAELTNDIHAGGICQQCKFGE